MRATLVQYLCTIFSAQELWGTSRHCPSTNVLPLAQTPMQWDGKVKPCPLALKPCTLLHWTWKWVLSCGEEQHSASLPQTIKQLKPSACVVLWAALCLPICLNRTYLSISTGALELNQREKAAFGMNPSLSQFGWDEKKRENRSGEWREDEWQGKVLRLLVAGVVMWPTWDNTFFISWHYSSQK